MPPPPPPPPKTIDKGLILFGFLMGIMAIIASIFASNTIPKIFETKDTVIATQALFNQSQIQTLDSIDSISKEILRLSNELKYNQEGHKNTEIKAKANVELNVQMTKINAKNIVNILNNISEINKKLLTTPTTTK